MLGLWSKAKAQYCTSTSLTVRREQVQESKYPSSLPFQQVSPSSLLPKLGLTIGDGQNTTPTISRKGSQADLQSFFSTPTYTCIQHEDCVTTVRFLWRKSPYTYQAFNRNTLSFINRKLVSILQQQLPTDPWNSQGNKDSRCFCKHITNQQKLSVHEHLLVSPRSAQASKDLFLLNHV